MFPIQLGSIVDEHLDDLQNGDGKVFRQTTADVKHGHMVEGLTTNHDVFTNHMNAYRNFTLGLPLLTKNGNTIRMDLATNNKYVLTPNLATDSKATNTNGMSSMLKKPRRRRTAFTQVTIYDNDRTPIYFIKQF